MLLSGFLFTIFHIIFSLSEIPAGSWLIDKKPVIDTVEKNYNDYDGFVITHGTDTMAYSASMLSCAINNLSKPIVFTGSQLPIKVEGTDACKNIQDAFLSACSDNCGVFLAFNGLIHNGDRAVYIHNFYNINSAYML